MADNLTNKIKRAIKRNKDLSFLTILFLGLLIIFLSGVDIGINRFSVPDGQQIYSNVFYNISAGLLSACIIYFLARFFLIDDSEFKSLDENSSMEMDDVNEITKTVRKIENAIQRIEITNVGFQAFFEKEKLFEQLNSIIQNANKSVYSIGYGFTSNTFEERELAEKFIWSVKQLLKDGAKEFRHYQYDSSLSSDWLEQLKELKIEFETSFSFYHGELGNSTHPMWLFITDPGEENSHTIVIFTKDVDSEVNGAYDFGVAFIFMDKEIALRKIDFFRVYFNTASIGRTQIQKLINDHKSKCYALLDDHLKSSTHDKLTVEADYIKAIGRTLKIYDYKLIKQFILDRVKEGRVYYFAYGIDMNQMFLEEFCAECIKIGPGHITRHTLELNGNGFSKQEKASRILNLIPDEKAEDEFVHGIIFSVKAELFDNLKVLKEKQGFACKQVRARWDKIVLVSQVFWQEKPKNMDYKVSKEYKTDMLALVNRSQFPEKYKKRVRQLFTK